GGGGWYPFPQVVLGWHPSEEVVGNSEYTELELVGFRVFAHQDTLERLRGKRIVLDKGQDMAGVDMLAVEGTVASRRGVREPRQAEPDGMVSTRLSGGPSPGGRPGGLYDPPPPHHQPSP